MPSAPEKFTPSEPTLAFPMTSILLKVPFSIVPPFPLISPSPVYNPLTQVPPHIDPFRSLRVPFPL